jgi:hypothetical protein
MSVTKTATLKVPGASLYYEIMAPGRSLSGILFPPVADGRTPSPTGEDTGNLFNASPRNGGAAEDYSS